MSLFSSSAPDAAIEISPESVSVAVIGTRGKDVLVEAHASEALPPGAVTAALVGHNVLDRSKTVEALRAALARLGGRPRRVGLIIPDLAARVSLVRFDSVPARREDLEQLIRWQVKKSAPFPIEDACLTHSLATRGSDGGGEFIVVLARRDIIREYEGVCEELGLHAGLVDLSTLSVVNLFLASDEVRGDWLVVHMRPDYTSLVIMRGPNMIFFRNTPEGDDDGLADVVHQTAMYHQDRLSGQGFGRVLLGGFGRTPRALDLARRDLEERLGTTVEPIDPTRVATLTQRISADSELQASLAPLVGMLLRTLREPVTA